MALPDGPVDVAIVGSGAAGLAAAVTAARLGVEPWVIEGLPAGGRLSTGTEVDGYPGFPRGIQAVELIAAFRSQAERWGARFVRGSVTGVALGERPFVVDVEGERLRARSLIVATGARPRPLEVPGAAELLGYGVSTCATCDGFFCKDEDAVVVGSGDTAVDDALYLATLCRRVLLVHRGERLRAIRALTDRLAREPRVEVRHRTEVEAVLGARGGGGVTGVRLRDLDTGRDSDVGCCGVFVALGFVPAAELFDGQLERGAGGTVAVRAPSTETSVRGVFAAGDVADGVYGQVATAAGDGCKAAIDAVRFLESRHG